MTENSELKGNCGMHDFVTISDTSADLSSLESASDELQSEVSVAETLSLSAMGRQTISPESYSSPEEENLTNRRWLFLGQPDDIVTAEVALEAGTHSEEEDGGNLGVDFDRQKLASLSHTRRRLQHIKRSLEEMHLCDMLISFGNSATPVHSLMFLLHDGFQKKKFLSSSSNGSLKARTQVDVGGDVTALAFTAIMNYVYDGQCQFAYENLAEVVTAVEFFGLTCLEEEIVETSDKMLVDEALLPLVFQGDPDHPLYDIAWSKLLQRFQVIATGGDFVALEVAEVCRLLGADGLAVASELQVFTWALQWLNAHRAVRSAHFVKVMKCVRFHFMTVEELTSCQAQEAQVMATKAIADLVQTAYIARPFILENDLSFLEQFELAPPRNLAVLERFSSVMDKKLAPKSDGLVDQQPSNDGEPSYLTKTSARSLSSLSLISSLHSQAKEMNSPTMSIKPNPQRHVASADDGSSLKSSVQGKWMKEKGEGSLHFMEPLDYYQCLSVSGKASRNHSRAASLQNSPSFSQMTFNHNGSLVTKGGGRLAHQTFNQAFEQIYSDKSDT
ncbi:hypothetical protein RvY_03241 [Ramazzottius varieornatus]|uniref:BTB domain-containing protein n=1 Tax=Ramazzottius varieornatus TaxID=947166 RepID=A0A1D1UWS6_RAMVA|nr:hypothetical protein RvY_03241 [Ramazzottius varieornatus]